MTNANRRLVLFAFALLCCPRSPGETPPEIIYSGREYRERGASYFQLWRLLPGESQSAALTQSARNHWLPTCAGSDQIFFLSTSRRSIVPGDRPPAHELRGFSPRTAAETLLWKSEAEIRNLLGWLPEANTMFLSLYSEGGGFTVAKLLLGMKKAVKLGDGCHPAVGAAGKQIAFDNCAGSVPAGKRPQITIVDDRGKLLGRRIEDALLPVWSPDGNRLAFVSGRSEIRIIDARSREPLRRFPLPPKSEDWNYAVSSAWQPSGMFLLVGSQAGNTTSPHEAYWLLDLERGTWRHVASGNGAAWSPDGRWIAYSSPRSLERLGRINIWTSSLNLLELESLQERALVSGKRYAIEPAWCAAN